MSNTNKDVKFSLKAVINKQKTKVLFAEAGSNFTDILLSFLTLPLGKIVRVLEKHYGDKAPVIGSLTTLYNGLSNLDNDHFATEGGKMMLLDPRSSSSDKCRKLNLDINDTQPTKYFSCENWNCGCPRQSYIGMYYGTTRCDCGKQLKKEIRVSNASQAFDSGGVFTLSTMDFVISDDLQILPNASASVIKILTDLGVTDLNGTELRNVTFGFNEVMDLLKGFIFYQTPLTDVILNKRKIDAPISKPEPGVLLHETVKQTTSDSKKMILKVIVRKSTNKLLFAKAREDFIDFLFSLLTIPLGGVEKLLDGVTCLNNIDNLYRSIGYLSDEKYLRSFDTKNELIEPKVPRGYLSKNQILPLVEESARRVFYYRGNCEKEEYMSLYIPNDGFSLLDSNFKSPKGEGDFVKGPRMYMVKDDLNVTPFCMELYLSILGEQKVPLTDVDELVLQIGLEEALNILKASLTTKSALSNGLNLMFMKKPKEEQ